MTAVSGARGQALVAPGTPRFRLSDETLRHLGRDPQSYPTAEVGPEKRVCEIKERFAAGPLPFGRVYVLADGASERAEELSPSESLIEVLRNSFLWGQLDRGSEAIVMKQCAAVVGCVSVYRLTRRQSLAHLPTVLEIIEEGCMEAGLGGPAPIAAKVG
jgi:hypothetical protein